MSAEDVERGAGGIVCQNSIGGVSVFGFCEERKKNAACIKKGREMMTRRFEGHINRINNLPRGKSKR